MTWPNRNASSSALMQAPLAGPLDLHEELSTPAPAELRGRDGRFPDPRGGCKRWPEHLWLVSSHGERVPGRCGSTNLCDYCARLKAVENTEMLALDAMEGNAPEVWCVLTTRTATLDMARFYRAREKLIKALRRRWPDCQYACLLEFTTGYGPRSGGKRRPHWNLLLKGVRRDEVAAVRAVVDRVWCGQVDAKPSGQYVGAVGEAGGLMRYLALHFQKESQAPPRGFKGQRFNCSRGYFTDRTRAEAREDAKESLWLKRQLYKAHRLGLEGDEAEDWIDAQLAREGLAEWRLGSSRPDRVQAETGQARAPRVVVHAALRYMELAEEYGDRLATVAVELQSESSAPPVELGGELPQDVSGAGADGAVLDDPGAALGRSEVGAPGVLVVGRSDSGAVVVDVDLVGGSAHVSGSDPVAVVDPDQLVPLAVEVSDPLAFLAPEVRG